jgi:hypothetical protein
MVEVFTAAAMEVAEEQGSAVAAWMDITLSLSSSLHYIVLGRTQQAPIPYHLRRSRGGFPEETRKFARFPSLGTCGMARYLWS